MADLGCKTFGTTGVMVDSDHIMGSWFTCPESGVANSIAAGIQNWSPTPGNLTMKFAIYKKSDNSLVGVTSEGIISFGAWSKKWVTLPILGVAPLSNTDYYLVAWSSSPDFGFLYTDDPSKAGSQSKAYDSWPDPWTPIVLSQRYSVYCTYTPGAASAPTITTSPVSDIALPTATGNGNITNTGGENCDKRGVCWNTAGNPTVEDSKSVGTNSFGTGPFTRPMTGLLGGTTYYVRAYAHNSAGYGYGDQVSFTTKAYKTPVTIGDVIDCTALIDTYDRIEWTEDLPSANQDIVVSIRSSPDNVNWTEWEAIYSSPCTSFTNLAQRYLEWRAVLTTTELGKHATLSDIAFTWSKTAV